MYIVLPLFCVPESWSHIDHNAYCSDILLEGNFSPL
jgi:hypothetical protein